MLWPVCLSSATTVQPNDGYMEAPICVPADAAFFLAKGGHLTHLTICSPHRQPAVPPCAVLIRGVYAGPTAGATSRSKPGAGDTRTLGCVWARARRAAYRELEYLAMLFRSSGGMRAAGKHSALYCAISLRNARHSHRPEPRKPGVHTCSGVGDHWKELMEGYDRANPPLPVEKLSGTSRSWQPMEGAVALRRSPGVLWCPRFLSEADCDSLVRSTNSAPTSVRVSRTL